MSCWAGAKIAHELKGLYKREATHGGRPEPCTPLTMFKLMLLASGVFRRKRHWSTRRRCASTSWCSTGVEPGDGSFTDATNICRFRNRLVAVKLDQVLLHPAFLSVPNHD